MTDAPVGTLVGSWPGIDVREAVRVAADLLPDLLAVPELPARGATAAITGRGAALLSGLCVDLQPAGWRLTAAPGVDHRRARSLLAADLDVLEEELQDWGGRLKTQVCGPWTLATTLERPRGDKVLADHGARREVAESLAEGVGAHVADLRRRVAGATEIVVQVDEPALVAVLEAAVPTASGFSRHRGVEVAEADRALRVVVEAVRTAGAVPVLHSCAARLPVDLVAGAGFAACSFDLGLLDAAGTEAWGAAVERGLAPWPGVVPTADPGAGRPAARALADRVARFAEATGADPGALVVTPACGLAGASPAWARSAARLVAETADAVAQSLAG